MRTSLLFISLLSLFSFAVFAKSPSNQLPMGESQIQLKHSCFSRFENFDAWMDFLKEKNGWFKGFILSFVFDEDDYNQYQSTLDCYTITYQSNGADVQGYLVAPKSRPVNSPLRTIIFNRGGNQQFGALTFAHLFNYIFPLAANGNVIVASQYRGLYKNERAKFPDEFGGKDVDDVVILAQEALKIPFVDQNRLFMLGQSRGAMMTYLAAKQDVLPIKAIATMGSLVDLQAEMEFRPNMEKVYKALIPNYAQNKEAAIKQRSAIHWVDDLPNIPILLQHGEDDERVNLLQVERFAEKLNQAKRPHQLIVYPNANHSLSNAREQAIKDVLAWFDAAETTITKTNN